ncbi:MAG: hypothetical protein PHG85_06645 [Candidatus Altiarchaeota archaeon]|nr:hypothetical protein [Candidatus Altiarchaeota archaeon]
METQLEDAAKIAALCRRAFGAEANGDYAIIRLPKGGRPEQGLCNLYANVFLTKGLLSNRKLKDGMTFELSTNDGRTALLSTPEDLGDLMTVASDKTVSIGRIYRRTGMLAAVVEGGYVIAKDNDGHPAPDEILNAFKPAKPAVRYMRIDGNTASAIKPAAENGRKTEDPEVARRIIRQNFRKTA